MSTAPPTVSVVIPCYNLGAYLDQAVQSVLEQTYEDFEIIIVDDGSTDPATRFLFASYMRPRTRILRTENRGLASARNLGIQEARGKYISCLDADDMLEPMFLERCVGLLDREPGVAFASVWLRAFGALEFDWHPSSCDFPDLLLEDSVCTAALTRREAILAVGGYDADMPVAGYEDWDLAIGLVERGYEGRIIPEYLFRYRIRRGSMAFDCGAPDNHAALMDYIVAKHPSPYRGRLPELLAMIERKCLDMEAEAACSARGAGADNPRSEIVSALLESVVGSTSWRLSRFLRRAVDAAGKIRRTPKASASPVRLSVVTTCRDQGVDLMALFRSLHGVGPADEVIVVDHGSSDPVTRHVLDGCAAAGARVLRIGPASDLQARALGMEAASGMYVVAVDPLQRLDTEIVPRSIETLENDRSCAFTVGGLQQASLESVPWRIEDAADGGPAGCSRYPFPVVRRTQLEAVGGYDATLGSVALADAELVLRLASRGNRGCVVAASVEQEQRASSPPDVGSPFPAVIAELVRRFPAFYERYWREAFLGHENRRRRLQAAVLDPRLPWKEEEPDKEWGILRRLEPISSVWGLDRGLPVDRYYIDRFLDRFRSDIRGRVLEVKEAHYTRVYDSGVEKHDVLDIAPDNPAATIVADLAVADSVPPDQFDCFVLTQTIHIIYDIREVVRNACRLLKPGGVLLATLPCVSRIDYESGVDGDYWRFTAASVRRLFEEAFPDGEVEVFTYGNVLSCCAFLMGLATEELTQVELDHADRYFPLIVCARAVKATSSAQPRTRASVPAPRAAVLLYHSISRRASDRWGLAVPPERFQEHVERLASRFDPIPLALLASQVSAGRVRNGSVVVTFDDGYLDNLLIALPTLQRCAVPATFFVSGDGAAEGTTFWWEELDAYALEAGLDDAAIRDLHARLAGLPADERAAELAGLRPPPGRRAARLGGEGMAQLATAPLAEIGGHGWSHRSLRGLGHEELEAEIRGNIEAIQRRIGNRVRLFAYPFGVHPGEAGVRCLRKAGIVAAVSVRDEPVSNDSDVMDLPRIEVGDWSGDDFERRLRGILVP